jgi:hypothetical protein
MNCKTVLTGIAFFMLAVIPLHANENMSVDEKVEKMKSNLALTDDQANQIKPILQDYKMKKDQLDQDKEQKLSAILNSTQMQQLREMKVDKDNKEEKMEHQTTP